MYLKLPITALCRSLRKCMVTNPLVSIFYALQHFLGQDLMKYQAYLTKKYAYFLGIFFTWASFINLISSKLVRNYNITFGKNWIPGGNTHQVSNPWWLSLWSRKEQSPPSDGCSSAPRNLWPQCPHGNDLVAKRPSLPAGQGTQATGWAGWDALRWWWMHSWTVTWCSSFYVVACKLQ